MSSEIPFESDDRPTSQQEQPNEPRAWISQENWDTYVEQNSNNRDRLNASIFRVPNVLVKDKTKWEAYVAQRVSLGPYHKGKAELLPMESRKERAMYRMMRRFNINLNKDSHSMDFAVCARNEIVQLEDAIRDIYEEEISCNGDMLARMLVLDGCFILEIWRTLLDRSLASNRHEHFFKENTIIYTASDTLTDILKLENQIPFFVLQKLLKLELASSDTDVEEKLFQLLVAPIVEQFSPFTENIDRMENCLPCQENEHLLGLLHTFIVSHDGHEGQAPNFEGPLSVNRRIRPAAELRNAGIKFQSRVGGITEIDFDEKKATIYLPPISISDSTEIVFRNLIAFELCKRFPINYVVRYVDLMDQLINSEEDAVLLRKKGIITNFLGSDGEVAELFNSLCKGVTLSGQDVFNELTHKVNEHYNNQFKVHCAELVRDKFSSPWKALGLVGGIALLGLTTVQTVFAILAHLK